jgi:hypothetical protein
LRFTQGKREIPRFPISKNRPVFTYGRKSGAVLQIMAFKARRIPRFPSLNIPILDVAIGKNHGSVGNPEKNPLTLLRTNLRNLMNYLPQG